MASESMNCRCNQPYKVKRMVIAFLAVYTFLCFPEHTLAVPDYRKLHESLSLKKDIANSNFKTPHQDGTPIIAEIGKVFKFSLEDFVLKGDGTNKPIVSSLIYLFAIYLFYNCLFLVCASSGHDDRKELFSIAIINFKALYLYNQNPGMF